MQYYSNMTDVVHNNIILVSSADLTIYTPSIGTHSSTVSSILGKFSAAIANQYNSAFLGSPGNHHSWVGRGSMD